MLTGFRFLRWPITQFWVVEPELTQSFMIQFIKIFIQKIESNTLFTCHCLLMYFLLQILWIFVVSATLLSNYHSSYYYYFYYYWYYYFCYSDLRGKHWSQTEANNCIFPYQVILPASSTINTHIWLNDLRTSCLLPQGIWTSDGWSNKTGDSSSLLTGQCVMVWLTV